MNTHFVLAALAATLGGLPAAAQNPNCPRERAVPVQGRVITGATHDCGGVSIAVQGVQIHHPSQGCPLFVIYEPPHSVAGPSDRDTQVQIAQLLLESNRTAEGSAILDRVLAATPRHPGANFHRAEALRRAGKREEAIRSYRAALAVQPDEPLLLHRLGNTYLDLNQLAPAREAFETAVRSGRATQGILASLGIVLARQGQPREAIQRWEEAIRLDPQSPMVPMLQKQIKELRGRAGG